MIKVIKSEEEHRDALAQISTLIDRDPDPGTADADRLELFTLLVENFESEAFPKRVPEPLEAIRFRVEQQNLKQRDPVPYIGSPSKVSEALFRKAKLNSIDDEGTTFPSWNTGKCFLERRQIN